MLSFRKILSYHLFSKKIFAHHYSKNTNGISDLIYGVSNKGSNSETSNVFKPIPVFPSHDDINFGEEIAGKIDRTALLRELNKFYLKPEIKSLSAEHGLDNYLYHQSYVSFRKYCLNVSRLPTELYIVFSDLLKGALIVDDIFPYFLSHSRKVFPHIECLVDLKAIGDLTDPSTWYPDARNMNRKIVFHAGPTNSGKTYHAMERFLSAKSGIYCGPLKLLAVEIFNKSNERGIPCDLITGEERKYFREDEESSKHVACTVEMANLTQKYEVAVIDEIQLLKDVSRGWAWTRALLGIQAEELHVCGEAAAINLVRELMISTGEEVEICNYKRLTPLIIEENALGNLKNVTKGDCIICFSKQDIYNISRSLDKYGIKNAVIYGSLPPSTKIAMANKFNDPNDPCNVLVATDAVGMGLNLNIRRIIFSSMSKLHLLDNGEKENDIISVSQALQIAGRAGRFNTQWETGYVTTLRQDDHTIMKNLCKQSPPEILQAGLHPTYEQIELYSYHLPHASLSNIVDIFISLAQVDEGLYTICNLEDFKFLADMIGHIKLPLKVMHTFCCAPINQRMPFLCTMFLKFARQYSQGEVITFDWMCNHLGWPFSKPNNLLDLIHLESVHSVFDTYLWLHYRFSDMFPDVAIVHTVRDELEKVIESGVEDLVQLIRNSESGVSSKVMKVAVDGLFESKSRSLNTHKRWDHDDKVKSDDSETRTVKKTPRKKLTEELIAHGLLTPSMIRDLKREWNDNDSSK